MTAKASPRLTSNEMSCSALKPSVTARARSADQNRRLGFPKCGYSLVTPATLSTAVLDLLAECDGSCIMQAFKAFINIGHTARDLYITSLNAGRRRWKIQRPAPATNAENTMEPRK